MTKTRPKIKFIVDTVMSKSDIYGNRYGYSVVTSTETGKSMTLRTPCHGNTTALLRRNWEWDEINGSESELPIRQWNSLSKEIDISVSIGKDDEIMEKVRELTR